MILWRGRYRGALAKVNEWLAGRLYERPAFKQRKQDLAVSLIGPASPVDGAADLVAEVAMWSMVDTDAPIKAIMDAMEMARVLGNDRQIRDVIIRRRYHRRGQEDGLRVWLVSTDTEYAKRVIDELESKENEEE